jgi:hypothetical protein
MTTSLFRSFSVPPDDCVRWIERHGYDVSYFAGLGSDRRGEKQ